MMENILLAVSYTHLDVYKRQVIRPFLEVRKQALRNYCHDYNVFYRDDYTNFETDFTRDFVRNVTLKKYSEKQIEELLIQAKHHNERYLKNLELVQVYIHQYHQKEMIDYHLIPDNLLECFIYEIIKEKMCIRDSFRTDKYIYRKYF